MGADGSNSAGPAGGNKTAGDGRSLDARPDAGKTGQVPEINFEKFDELLAATPDVPLEDVEFTLQGVDYVVSMPVGTKVAAADKKSVKFEVSENEKVEVQRAAILMPEFRETSDDYNDRQFPYVDDDTLIMAKSDAMLTSDARVFSVHRHVRAGYRDLVFASPTFYLTGENTLEECLRMCKYCQTLRVKDPLPTDSAALLATVGVVPTRFRRPDGAVARSVNGTSACFSLIAERLPDVEVLYLSDTNDLRATDFEQLAKCSKLTELRVPFVHGRTLREISKLSGLHRLRIALTEVKDEDFSHLAQMPNLESLDVNLDDCEDAGLKHLAGMPSLKELRVDKSYAKSTGEALLAIQEFTRLERLAFNAKLLTDEDLAHFAGLSNLKSLDLARVFIQDKGWEHLAGLSSLEYLRLAGGETFVGGEKVKHRNSVAGMQQLAKLPNLSGLELQNGSFEKGALAELAAAAKFNSLTLVSVELADEDLEALAGLKSLKRLYHVGSAEQNAKLDAFFAERRPDVQLGDWHNAP